LMTSYERLDIDVTVFAVTKFNSDHERIVPSIRSTTLFWEVLDARNERKADVHLRCDFVCCGDSVGRHTEDRFCLRA
jgi:hypothetical protein